MTPEEQEKSDALIQEAVEHYSAQRYAEAIECFTQAHEILEEPELLFNIARSHEKLSNHQAAIAWYERFLTVPGTTSDLRTRALKAITALRKELAAQKAAQRSEEATAQATSTPPPTTEPSAEPTSPDQTTTSTDTSAPPSQGTPATSEEPDQGPSPLRIASYALLGSGGAGLILGGIFGGLSLSAKDDFESAGYDPKRVGYREDMERNALIFDVAFFTGAGLVVIGVSLFVVDVVKGNSEKAETQSARRRGIGRSLDKTISVVPTFMVGTSGLTGGLVGRF